MVVLASCRIQASTVSGQSRGHNYGQPSRQGLNAGTTNAGEGGYIYDVTLSIGSRDAGLWWHKVAHVVFFVKPNDLVVEEQKEQEERHLQWTTWATAWTQATAGYITWLHSCAWHIHGCAIK